MMLPLTLDVHGDTHNLAILAADPEYFQNVQSESRRYVIYDSSISDFLNVQFLARLQTSSSNSISANSYLTMKLAKLMKLVPNRTYRSLRGKTYYWSSLRKERRIRSILARTKARSIRTVMRRTTLLDYT
jgi:hypothetical protein